MNCPTWCNHHTADRHPLTEDHSEIQVSGLPAGTAEHERIIWTGPLDSGEPLSVEIGAMTTPDHSRNEGPGVQLVGLINAANAGRYLTPADARSLAAALSEAADVLEAAVALA